MMPKMEMDDKSFSFEYQEYEIVKNPQIRRLKHEKNELTLQ